MKEVDPLYALTVLVHNTGTYEDRLRSTNVKEFTLDEIYIKQETEFVRDTTLEAK